VTAATHSGRKITCSQANRRTRQPRITNVVAFAIPHERLPMAVMLEAVRLGDQAPPLVG
jgi:hypothetical protein